MQLQRSIEGTSGLLPIGDGLELGCPGRRKSCLRALYRGLKLGWVYAEEELAATDELSFLHRDGDDAPGDVRRDIYRALRLDLATGNHRRHQVATPHLLDADLNTSIASADLRSNHATQGQHDNPDYHDLLAAARHTLRINPYIQCGRTISSLTLINLSRGDVRNPNEAGGPLRPPGSPTSGGNRTLL